MSEPWEVVSAGQVARIEIGGTPAREQGRFWADEDTGNPWASIADLSSPVVERTAEYISDLGAASSNVKLVPAGTPMMSFKLTIGRTSRAGTDLYTNEAVAAFFVDRLRVDPDWLVHALPDAAAAVVTDVAIKGATLNKQSLNSMPLRLPPIAEQRAMAKMLDTLDDQIRASESIMAKRAIIEAAVFNDLLRSVQGGSDRRLGDLLLVSPKNGYSPVEASEPTGEYMLGLGCLTKQGFVPRQLKHAPKRDARLHPFLLRDGDVLMSRSNTRDRVGHAGVFRDVGAPCYYPDLMMRLVPSGLIGAEYLANVLNSPSVRRQIMNVASGTSGSMVKISRPTVEALVLPVPSRADQDRIVAKLVDLRRLRDLDESQLQKAKLLKTGLARDLLAGRVRVPSEAHS